ncbi:MAG: NAD(P)-binding domain-containing protein [Bacteroidota bacterium]
MNIGILGSGEVGRTLGAGFAARGHDVHLGTRSPDRNELRQWASDTGASVAAFDGAAAFGHVLVLATAWDGTENAVRLAGPDHFAGKTVLDATNPLDFSEGSLRLAVSGEDSSGERVQAWLPEAHVVKCFNTVGAGLMVDPDLPGGPPTMFIAGNDEHAKKTAAEVLSAFGWEGVDLGGIEMSRHLDALAIIWITHAMRTQSRDHAFKLLAG